MPRLQLKALRTRLLGPLDLSIEPGQCVAVSGPSGSGKTLLLRALADLDVHEGEVLLDGRRCADFAPPDWRRRVALLGADSPWWLAHVGAHFCRGDPEGLAQLGFGPETMDWDVERLSSGERQRLALLRLLCNRPQALLLDEPTANLDAASAEAVERLVRDYRQRHQAPVLWVSHDAAQIRRVADRHLRIQGATLEAAA